MCKYMIEYSKQESAILGIPFGRLNIEENFTEWDFLKNEIDRSECQLIRLKAINPTPKNISEINNLCTKVQLIEILRAFTTTSLHDQILSNSERGTDYIKVDSNNKDLFLETFTDTYEDIPFGSYTPDSVLKQLNTDLQLNVLSQYFYQNYTGNNKQKEAYLIYDLNKQIAGCLAIDFYVNESYTYYVGVKKAFRNQDILQRTISFIHRITKAKNLEFAKGSARLHNLFSQKAFDKSGMTCTGYDWVFLLEK